MNDYTRERLTNELREHAKMLYASEFVQWKADGFSVVHRYVDVSEDRRGKVIGTVEYIIVNGATSQHLAAHFERRAPLGGSAADWYCARDWRDDRPPSPNP